MVGIFKKDKKQWEFLTDQKVEKGMRGRMCPESIYTQREILMA